MLATIALSLSVVCLGQAKAPSPAPEDLIERHIEATGGMRALADIKGLHRVWSLKSGEFTGTMETNWSPEAFRTSLTSSDGTWTMAWGQDSQGAWQQQPDGSMAKVAPAQALMLKLQADPGALLRRDDYVKRVPWSCKRSRLGMDQPVAPCEGKSPHPMSSTYMITMLGRCEWAGAT